MREPISTEAAPAAVVVRRRERLQTLQLRLCQIPRKSYNGQRISGRHGHGQHLQCHHANSGSAIGS